VLKIAGVRNGRLIVYKGPPRLAAQAKQRGYYTENEIQVSLRNHGYVKFSTITDISQRRMIVSCLTSCKRKMEKSFGNVELTFDALNNTVSIEMEYLNLWNMGYGYGPFKSQFGPIYFYLFQNKVWGYHQGIYFDESSILIKQGNIVTPLQAMILEEREFLFRDGDYTTDRQFSSFPCTVPNRGMHYIPTLMDKKRIFIHEGKLIIERDFVCVNHKSVTIYQRWLGPSTTQFEIDCWGEKDPLFARFIRLMIAIYAQNTVKVNCLARNKEFTSFVFDLAFDKANDIFTQAIVSIVNKMGELKHLLTNYKVHDPNTYSFTIGGRDINVGGGYSKIDFVTDKRLIEDALGLINGNQ
ncbi:MAG: hypothetical protein ACK4M7_10165, partial [Burkholderiales bacterium]